MDWVSTCLSTLRGCVHRIPTRCGVVAAVGLRRKDSESLRDPHLARWRWFVHPPDGLDYAVNRCYSSGLGRFTSADPYVASGGPGDPGSWNRYAFVSGDPMNLYDPEGLYTQMCPPGEVRIKDVGCVVVTSPFTPLLTSPTPIPVKSVKEHDD